MSRQRIKRRVVFGALLTGVTLAGAGLYHARYVEPEALEVTRVPLFLPRLAPAFDGYRVALIGDIHADAWMTPGRLLRLVEIVNAQGSDLIVVTGDFNTYSPLRSLLHHVPGLAAPLRRLRAPDGVFAVLGNHDHKPPVGLLRRPFCAQDGSRTAEVVRSTLARGGIHELRNAVHTLRRGDATLHLCGVDSARKGMGSLEDVLERLPPVGAAVLLAHEPDLADAADATSRFDLQLSGHSHGGQVRLPLVGAVAAALPPLGRKYPAGLYGVGSMLLYTNRGLGSHPRLRFRCRPEVTILTLRAQGGPDVPPSPDGRR